MTTYYEEFEVGETAKTGGRTVTETDIVNFAGITGDNFWLHMDRERAADGPFGERVAHGALVFSLMSGLVINRGHLDESLVAYYGIRDLRFLGPTKIGDTIHVVQEVTEKRVRDEDSGVVQFTDEAVNQRGEVVVRCVNEALVERLSDGS